jgi:hypothetical protein
VWPGVGTVYGAPFQASRRDASPFYIPLPALKYRSNIGRPSRTTANRRAALFSTAPTDRTKDRHGASELQTPHPELYTTPDTLRGVRMRPDARIT